jgi:ProP effector
MSNKTQSAGISPELTPPPPTTPEKPEQVARDLIGVLADFWPLAFSLYQWRRRPLKLGIRQDIEAAAAGAITADELNVALRSYTRNVGYLCVCKEGVPRIDLDGEPAGHVTADDAGHAARLLDYKRSKQLAAANTLTATIPAPPAIAAPRRLSLDDLRAAAAERRRLGAQP